MPDSYADSASIGCSGYAMQRQVWVELSASGLCQYAQQWKGVKFQLDTGAICNVLKRNEVSKETKIMPTTQMITLYDGSRVKPCGKCRVKVTNPRIEKTYDVEFVVIQDAQNSILGLATVQQMGLLTVHHEMIQKSTHTQCSRSIIQCLRRQLVLGNDLHLDVDLSVKPVQMPVRRIPVAIN